MGPDKLKTLWDLWLESGKKPGLKVISRLGTACVVMGEAPNGSFYGYELASGESAAFSDMQTGWCFYTEPKKKVTKYLWASKDAFITGRMLSNEEVEVMNVDADNPMMGIKYSIRLDWSATEFEEGD